MTATRDPREHRLSAERVAAWATAVGIGAIALMLAWLVGNRLTALVWPPPVGPTVAIVAALVVAVATVIVAGISLTDRR